MYISCVVAADHAVALANIVIPEDIVILVDIIHTDIILIDIAVRGQAVVGDVALECE